MNVEPLTIAGVTVARAKEGGGVELVAERDGRAVRIDLTGREAMTLVVGFFRAVPEALGRETLSVLLGAAVGTMPAAAVVELGLGLLAPHRDVLAGFADLERAERGAGVPEA